MQFICKQITSSDRILQGWISFIINPWGGITTVCIVYTNNRQQYIREKMVNISAKFSDTGKILHPPRRIIYRPAPHYRPSQ